MKKILILAIIAGAVVWVLKFNKNYPSTIDLKHEPGTFGITYSPKFAKDLGLDPKEAYLALIDDLKVRNVRLPIYWDDIEKEEGVFDFSEPDYFISEGAKRGVKFIVNVGWRLPRWPECHAPLWTANSDVPAIREKSLTMIKAAIEHYKDYPEVVYWQVENEPLLNSFGICPDSDEEFLKKEVALVRSLDNSRQIIISGSGELSSWVKEGRLADWFGTTMYRVVWNSIFGYVHYPFPASFYRFKADWAKIPKDKRMIIELQAEPWVPKGNMKDIEPKDYEKSMSLEQFRGNIQYGLNIGFGKIYLWGAEWWYLQKQKGHNLYWEAVRPLFD